MHLAGVGEGGGCGCGGHGALPFRRPATTVAALRPRRARTPSRGHRPVTGPQILAHLGDPLRCAPYRRALLQRARALAQRLRRERATSETAVASPSASYKERTFVARSCIELSTEQIASGRGRRTARPEFPLQASRSYAA